MTKEVHYNDDPRVDMLAAAKSWPGIIAVQAFDSRPASERRIAGLLEGLRYAHQLEIPELWQRIPKRNFELRMEERGEKGMDVSLVKDGQGYLLNQHLAPGYRIVRGKGKGGYCNFAKKTVEVSDALSDKAAFVYDLLHEMDHSEFQFIRNVPGFGDLCNALDDALRSGSEDDKRRQFDALRMLVETFAPLTSLASSQRDAMLRLFGGEISPEQFSVEDEKVRGAMERRAWEFAERIFVTLEGKGFDFGMTAAERIAYSRFFLSTYAVPRLQAALLREGEEKFRQYESPFLKASEYDYRLQAALEGRDWHTA